MRAAYHLHIRLLILFCKLRQDLHLVSELHLGACPPICGKIPSCWSRIVPLAEERWHRRGHSKHRDPEHQEGKNQRWAAVQSRGGRRLISTLQGENLKLCVKLSRLQNGVQLPCRKPAELRRLHYRVLPVPVDVLLGDVSESAPAHGATAKRTVSFRVAASFPLEVRGHFSPQRPHSPGPSL